MKAKILAILFAALLAAAPAAAKPADILKSVRPLQVNHAVMIVSADESGAVTILGYSQHFDNICTVSSINQKRHYWITAAHCVEGDETLYIDGDVANVILRDVKNDIAILHTNTAYAPALKLARKGPEFGDKVVIAGHPLGWKDVVLSQGYVMNPNWYLPDARPELDRPFMLLQLVGAPGNSGSPIVDEDNRLVSILQIGWGRGFSPIMGGALYEMLKPYADYWR